MASRLELHEEFCEILGTRNAYYNPPESVKMNYPGIRYVLAKPDSKKANNGVYQFTNRYEVTVIDPNPDSIIPAQLLSRFPLCSWDRTYKANNLNHTVLSIYY